MVLYVIPVYAHFVSINFKRRIEGATRLDKIINKKIRESLGATPVI